jgi:dCMP deaminase
MWDSLAIRRLFMARSPSRSSYTYWLVVEGEKEMSEDRTLEQRLEEANRVAEEAGRRLTGGSRVDWHHYFMNIAHVVATRATCDRKHVGAVIVRDKNILSTGYNGSIRGLPHCDDVGHDMVAGHCVRTVHAEANAIIQAARHGVRIDGADIYTTASPCWECFKLIANAGIRRIFYGEFYREEKCFEVARQLGIELIKID